MKRNNYKELREEQLGLARETEELAEEVKLMAINLAITLAKVRSREQTIKDMEPQFSELVKRANEASHQVTAILQGILNQKKMASGGTAVIGEQPQPGIYNKLEVALNYVNDLSQNIIKTITRIKTQQVR